MKTKDWIKQKAVTGAIFLAGLLSFKGGQASAAVPQDNKNKQNITNVQQASLKETGIPAPQFYFETANKLDLNDKSINWVEFSAEEMMSTLNKTEYSDRQKLEIMKYYTEYGWGVKDDRGTMHTNSALLTHMLKQSVGLDHNAEVFAQKFMERLQTRDSKGKTTDKSHADAKEIHNDIADISYHFDEKGLSFSGEIRTPVQQLLPEIIHNPETGVYTCGPAKGLRQDIVRSQAQTLIRQAAIKDLVRQDLQKRQAGGESLGSREAEFLSQSGSLAPWGLKLTSGGKIVSAKVNQNLMQSNTR